MGPLLHGHTLNPALYPFSQDREATPRSGGGDKHTVQRPTTRYHLHPGTTHLR
jgi:hypothetical protein